MGRGWGAKESFRRLIPATACFFGKGKETAATKATLFSRVSRKGPFLAQLNISFNVSELRKLLSFLEEACKATSLMAETVIWGTKSFQVPEYFNFADVIDEWAQKEKVKTEAV